MNKKLLLILSLELSSFGGMNDYVKITEDILFLNASTMLKLQLFQNHSSIASQK